MSDAKPVARTFSRRRRANVEGGRLHRHVVKVSPEEEGALLLRANAKGTTVARYLVESALADSTGDTVTDRQHHIADLFVIHRGLSQLGNNLNQIARQTNAAKDLPVELRGPLLELLRSLKVGADKLDDVIDRLSER
ncbi:plasmid mobilization relaxosome protein MobC [Leucobacter sp. UCMA 4100]|uniref:plasmid mobilization protein n=1 Tax=Leucobacter sp. UCMA 4100 TaxID=2810534 RepID=UPI0022EB2289|nr:plasmid mobilization relaxosome protein MobC [Leucobacter sp. UCMA 4100]MDA3145775.1 plasmid mobilization relaxosome protein MobC [Leucobacter sp. UCMA 4100]